MRKAIAVISNDQHIKQANTNTIVGLFKQKIALAKTLGVKTLFGLGDIFDSRTSQRLSCLMAFREIVDLIEEAGMDFIIIPGNHDKTKYDSQRSFLAPFKEVGSMRVVEDLEYIEMEGLSIALMPFFTESMMVERLESLKEVDLLMCHLEVNGSVNNGIVADGRDISLGMLGKAKKVVSGHYHNAHQVGNKFFHLPSIYQANYGEDKEKGFTILYDDGGHEHFQSDFKAFETVKVDLDTTTPIQLKELIKTHKNSDDNIRFELRGSDEKLEAVDKAKLSLSGIDYKVKREGFDVEDFDEKKLSLPKMNRSNVKAVFKTWCKQEELEYKEGIKYIE